MPPYMPPSMITGAPRPHLAYQMAQRDPRNENGFLSALAQGENLQTKELATLSVRAISNPGTIPPKKSSPIEVLVAMP